ncbi:bacteriophage abortive infection AbiH family protein [Leptotrichia hofstadii]|nr:bacteriophage abortive infection AbiH family protein [Leptotrichia hofstadii]
MKRLYILENSFDLYMGMKTSYNDFFENGGYSSIKKN